MSDTDTVHILGAEPTHNYMADVYDPSTERYARFEPQRDASGRDKLRGLGFRGARVTGAVVDTGVLMKHPDIRRQLIDAVDFTGEGLDDENGHGTVVTLLLLAEVPEISLISVKVLDRNGDAQPARLLEAFRWLKDDKRAMVINLSAGVTRPRCKGDCDICEAARDVVRSGKAMVVAAGNIPGITACPAKASDSVLTVTVLDESGRLASYASPATERGIAGREPILRTSWVDGDGTQA